MKLINEIVTVCCVSERPIAGQSEPQPQTVLWQGRHYCVGAIMSTWRWRGAWWTTPMLAGRERIYFRVMCALSGGSGRSSGGGKGQGREVYMELYREDGRWTLSRLLD